ncbi:MAG: type 4a pilus biogenesis protein PilO [Myxococcota bacterium]|nr:type 4a pilus biogenesis protein PilO [Myxococcota bacterium]
MDKLVDAPGPTKVAIAVLVCGLVAAGWYTLYYSESADKVSEASRRTPRLNKELRQQREIEKNLEKFKQEISTLKQARDQMRDRLPDSPAIAGLLQQIHSQAKVVGLQVESFKRSKDQAETLYARIPVKMTLVGSFHQVATFFYYLGRLTRIVNVEDITLVTQERDETKNIIRAECQASTFMYLRPADEAEGQQGG